MPLKDCPHPLCHRENDELEKSHAALFGGLKEAWEFLANGSLLKEELKVIIAQAEKVQHDLSLGN